MLNCTFGKAKCFGLIILNPLKLSRNLTPCICAAVIDDRKPEV